jgi:hypothetical protein
MNQVVKRPRGLCVGAGVLLRRLQVAPARFGAFEMLEQIIRAQNGIVGALKPDG